MDNSVFIGVLSEISMRAKILRERLRDDPDSVFDILPSIERLEDELLMAISNFGSNPHK